jgi:hypothetical protein
MNTNNNHSFIKLWFFLSKDLDEVGIGNSYYGKSGDKNKADSF